MILALIILPVAAGFAIPIVGKRSRIMAGLVAATASFLILCAVSLILPQVLKEKQVIYIAELSAPFTSTMLAVDALSALLLVTVNIVSFLVLLYSIDYVRRYTDPWKFFSLFMFMLAGINGVLVSCDIFTLYIFLEIAAIAGYFLVSFGLEDEALEAAFKYAVMGSVASIFILLGIAILYSFASTLNMVQLGHILVSAGGPGKVILFVAVLFAMGFGLKAAFAPFHSWLPYAHSSAPAPVSAMLSGVSIKVLGIYALMRIYFNVFGMNSKFAAILISLGILSMLVGSLLAFGQKDIKRLFAYSSIGQVGYIALGLGLWTPLGIAGALFHLINHSVFKSLLFLNSGSIEEISGTRDLGKIRGLASTSPVVSYTTLIGALSICGLPPFGGFWSKLIIIIACVKADRPGLALVAVLVSVLTIAYYFKALTPALFAPPDKGRAVHRIRPLAVFSLIVLGVIVLSTALVLIPNTGTFALLCEARAVLTDGRLYPTVILGR